MENKWMMRSIDFHNLTVDEIRHHLCTDPAQPCGQVREPGINFPPEMKFRDAAVLVPLLRQDNTWHVLLTSRTDMVQDHKNQVSFPGGAVEVEDIDRIQTALRETWEEIGLRSGDVTVLGYLPNYPTVSGFMITPVIGVIPWPYPFTLSINEVKRVFTIPLNWIADPANYEERIFTTINSIPRKALFYKEYDGEILWGISARIAVELANALNQARNQSII
jgi:8-oxo-dGTP pyrophosphatase MutT (NUDIX family)